MKKNLVLLLVVILTLSVASAVMAEDVTVTWWHTFTEGQEETLQAIINEFNESHPGVTVVAESQPYDGFEAKVYEAVSNGTGPDIIFNYASTATDYVEAGLIVNFNDYMVTDYKSRVSEGVYLEGTGFEDGGLYAVAVQSTGPILFYNKTMYDQAGLTAPTTWDQVESNSKAIYEKFGVAGFAFDSLTDGFQSLLMQSGGQYVDLENKVVLFNTPEFVKWVEWFQKGVEEGYFSLAPTTGNYNSNDMSAKVLAAYIGSSAGLPYLDLGEDELATAPMPLIEGGVNWVPAWNRSALVFKSNEAEERAAVEFVEYFTNEVNAGRWAESLVAFTPYKDTRETEAYQAFVDGNIALTSLGQQIDYAYVLPNFVGANAVRNEIKALVEKASTGQMTAQEAVDAAEVVSNAAMQE